MRIMPPDPDPREPHNPPIVIPYTRVSTIRQADSRLGLEAARSGMEQFVAAKGWEVLYWIEEPAKSGATMATNPGLQKALRSLSSGEADILLGFKIDRIGRNAEESLKILRTSIEEGWQLAALDFLLDPRTDVGELVFTIMAGVARFEWRRGKQRSYDSTQAKKARGEPVGGQMLVNPVISDWIVEMAAQGTSQRKIAAKLNESGIPTERGAKQWSQSTIQAHLVARKRSGRPNLKTRNRIVRAEAHMSAEGSLTAWIDPLARIS